MTTTMIIILNTFFTIDTVSNNTSGIKPKTIISSLLIFDTEFLEEKFSLFLNSWKKSHIFHKHFL